MSNLIAIKRRIRSAKNIKQMTKAMEMVSASKMRKAQEAALSARPFTEGLTSMLSSVKSVGDYAHPLLRSTQNTGKTLILMISTNKGMCGGLNVNLSREVFNWLKNNNDQSVDIALVGKKAKTVFPGVQANTVARFETVSEAPTFLETRAIATYVKEVFVAGEYDTVYCAYPKFISTLQNEISLTQLLPLKKSETAMSTSADMVIEPSPKALLDTLLPYRLEMMIYQTIIEARATEHSARMVAMKNASDNARDLISNLTLDYNQARQSHVTSELLDVTTARMALED
jgi:F-type H+-transporting ATPase subunit gamma